MKILLTLVIVTVTGWMVWPFGKSFSFFRQLESIHVVNVASTPGPAPSAAGTITGRVSMAQAAASTGRASRGLYGKSVSRLATASASRQAVVFVESVSGQFAVPQVRPAMRQRNITIVPRVLPILRGTTVDFPNEDKIFHNIFSLSPTRSFDLGRYAQGLSKSVTFDKTGEVKVFCDIHSTMSGFILVLQNPYFATTEQDGGYRIANVPSGTYRLGAWTESGINWQNVTVGGGETVTVNFNF